MALKLRLLTKEGLVQEDGQGCWPPRWRGLLGEVVEEEVAEGFGPWLIRFDVRAEGLKRRIRYIVKKFDRSFMLRSIKLLVLG
jgi:hypothetical protein